MITDLNRAALQLLTQESSVTKPHTLLGQPLADMDPKVARMDQSIHNVSRIKPTPGDQD